MKHSEETKEKLRQKRLGTFHSPETIKKISESSKERIFSQSVRKIMIQRNIEINGKKIYCVQAGKEFESISAAARSINTAPICISRVANGIRESIKGYSYRFI